MKKALALLMALCMVITLFTGCGGNNNSDNSSTPETDGSKQELKHKITYIVTGGTLGDQANNDGLDAGLKSYADTNGADYNAIELAEVVDIDSTVRQVISNGCDLVVFNSPDASDMMDDLCPAFPDVWFVMYNGTNNTGHTNLVNITPDVAGAAFLCGVFAASMNKEINGELKAGYVGGVRNPNLERARYAMQAAVEMLGGELNAVYVGSFNDATAAKEITTQMFNDGVRVVQAWAGGCNKGVFEAAANAGEGYYAMGGATGQFHMSDSIVASLAANLELAMETICTDIYNGTIEAGNRYLTVEDGTISCVYAPDARADAIPESVKAVVEEYLQKLVSGEIVAPSTEEEYNAFSSTYLK